MAFSLTISQRWSKQGWKVKIRDRERCEPPHVTIIWRTKAWRMDLRTGKFLDKEPNPSEIPADLIAEVEQKRPNLQTEWDKMYPENPIASSGDEDE